MGRFISADTLIPNVTDPQDFNRYTYAKNYPTRFTDPSGHCVFSPADAAACYYAAVQFAASAGGAAAIAAAAGPAAAAVATAAVVAPLAYTAYAYGFGPDAETNRAAAAADLAEDTANGQGSVGGAEGLPSIPDYDRDDWGYEKQPLEGTQCAYCGQETTETPRLPNSAENDHIVSLKEAHESGGHAWSQDEKQRFANDPSNQVNACKSCNASKGSKPIESWGRSRVDPKLKDVATQQARQIRRDYGLSGPR